MEAPAIITGLPCRYCHALVPIGEINALQIGEIVGGTVCSKCFLDHLEKDQILIEQTNEICLDGEPYPCARCHRRDCDEMYLHWIDGAMSMLCPPCSDWYIEKDRQQWKGTQFEWEAKLR